MRVQHSASPDDIDLVSIGGAVKRSLPKLLIGALIVGAVTFAVLSALPSKYTSLAQLQIRSKSQPPSAAPNAGAQTADPTKVDREAVGSHVRGLQSDALSFAVAKEMKLGENPEFNTSLPRGDLFSRLTRLLGLGGTRSTESQENNVIESYKKSLRVFQVRDTREVMVEFTAEDAQLAAAVANKIADLYKANQSVRTGNDAEEVRAKLKPQIEKVAREYADAQQREIEFRSKSDQYQTGNTPQIERQLEELNKELVKANALRADSESRAQAAREMMKAGTAEAHPDVQRSGLVPRLVEQRVRQQRQIAELSASLLPAHPRMKQLNADLAGLSGQIKGEVQKVIDSIEKEAKVAVSREDNVRRQLEGVKKSIGGKTGDLAKLGQFEAETKARKAELERLQGQLLAADSTAESPASLGEVEIISRARPSTERSQPKPSLIAPFAMVATLLLGLAWTVTRELVLGARGGPAPAQMATKLSTGSTAGPVVREADALPSFAPPEPDAEVSVKTSPAAPIRARPGDRLVVTSMAALSRQLLGLTEGQGGFRSLVTGERDGIDGSSAALDLAKALSAAGRQVVLVDWSQDGKGIVPAAGAGVSELLRGEASFEDVIARLPDTEAHAVGAGIAHDRQLGLEAERVNLVLDALDEAYDHIVVFAPHKMARDLFAAIEGRFDAGITACEARPGAATPEDGNSFLGYQVNDLLLFRFAPQQPEAPLGGGVSSSRLNLARGRGPVQPHA